MVVGHKYILIELKRRGGTVCPSVTSWGVLLWMVIGRPVPRFTRCCLSRDGLTEVNYWNVATTQETKGTICTQATRVYMVDGLSNCVTVTSSNPVSFRSSTLPVRTHIQYSVLKYGCMYRLPLIYSSFGGYLRTSKYKLYRNSVLHPNPERQVHLNL